MSEHIATGELELYVIGALDEVAVARVDAHLATCAPCMRALAREASLEMAFEAVARGDKPARGNVHAMNRARSARAVAVACAVGGALSLAAAWMLWVVPANRASGAGGESAWSEDDASGGTTASLDARWRDRVLDGG